MVAFVDSDFTWSESNFNTDLTINVPAHSAGDFAIAFVRAELDVAADLYTSASWTKRRNDRAGDGFPDQSDIFYKELDGAESSVTFTFNDTTLHKRSGLLLIFSGVDTSTPFDVTEQILGDTTGGNDTTPVNPAITPVTDNGALVLVHMPEGPGGTYSAWGAPATPSGMSTPIATTDVTDSEVNIVTSYKADYGSAATITPTDWTHTYSGSDFVGYRLYTVALRPSSGVDLLSMGGVIINP